MLLPKEGITVMACNMANECALCYKSLGTSPVVMGHAGYRCLLSCSFQILFQLKDLENVENSICNNLDPSWDFAA